MKKLFTILAILFTLSNSTVFAWNGYDYDSGHYIEISDGELVRRGRDIDVYDLETGRYKTYEVENVSNGEVEVYDWDTGEYKTFDMDD